MSFLDRNRLRFAPSGIVFFPADRLVGFSGICIGTRQHDVQILYVDQAVIIIVSIIGIIWFFIII